MWRRTAHVAGHVSVRLTVSRRPEVSTCLLVSHAAARPGDGPSLTTAARSAVAHVVQSYAELALSVADAKIYPFIGVVFL